ncbi:MAG TPA: hypothetical protein VH257_19060, partial [Chloroflexota bacterium]|nr:hypothetical protein [Chloroflexota bacterium]
MTTSLQLDTNTPNPPEKSPRQQAESDEMKALAGQRRGQLVFTGPMIRRALGDSLRKLNPLTLA